MECVLVRFDHVPRFVEDRRILLWIEWFKENNIKYEFGYIDGREAGVYLDADDALLFKIKFGIL